MGCCNRKSLLRVEDPKDGVSIKLASGQEMLIHRDDIVSYSVSESELSISLSIGFVKNFNKEDIINFDEVLNAL